MNRLKSLLSQPGMHVFIFLLAILLLGWPFLSISDQGNGKSIFFYLFGAWGILIFVLFLINISLQENSSDANWRDEE